jgi:uncharacterized protein (TIGR03435 family)
MKKRLLSTLLFIGLQAGVLFGQTFTGTWQGALKIPQARNGELRTVIKISTTEADKLAAVFYSIDQGGQPANAATVTANGPSLKLTFPQMNGTYEGKLSPDGKTIDGTWSQGNALPLVLTKATSDTAWTIPDPPPPPKMMDPNAQPSFEVATIKPSNPDQPGWGIGVNQSGMINTRNTTLADLIKFAYDAHPKQVFGAPAWFDTDKFDLTAKPDKPGIPTVNQMKVMMQKLLEDRFSLTFHREKRELTAYTVTVAKGGEKIQKETNVAIPVPGFGGPPQRGFFVRNATMAEFASVLQAQFLDQPVVDQTALGATRYTFTIKFTPDPGMGLFGAPQAPPPPTDSEAPPDIYAAMEQQLGLHIQKTRAPVDVMILDKVEKPSQN